MKKRIDDVRLDNRVELLFSTLLKTGSLKEVVPASVHFHDEPRMFLYTALFKGIKIEKYEFESHNIVSHGFSFKSKSFALLKCMSEGVERISISGYKFNDIVYSSFSALETPSINMGEYFASPAVKHQKIGWVKGRCLTNNSDAYIPAQLLYLNYIKKNKERVLSPIISTGASAGFDHESTVLRGICEVVERDAFMTIYLNKISVPQIRISTINNDEVNSLNTLLKRYLLELHVFDFTNDLKIPVYVSIIVDRTGKGPAVSVGAKCGFHTIDSIIGSIEEAFMARLWLKKRANIFVAGKNSLPWWPMSWWPVSMIKKLDFLLKDSTVVPFIKKWSPQKDELDNALKCLKEKKHGVYCSDVTLPNFKKNRLYSVKILIPSLQPLYLDIKNKKINNARLNEVALYFGIKRRRINTIHHPFL